MAAEADKHRGHVGILVPVLAFRDAPADPARGPGRGRADRARLAVRRHQVQLGRPDGAAGNQRRPGGQRNAEA